MCPKCGPLSPQRLDFNHISPRFGCCPGWEVKFNEKPFNNVYEAYAGDNGFVFALGKELCECGSGELNIGLMSGKVELVHRPHPRRLLLDDGSHLLIECPTMHLGPLQDYTAPDYPLKEALKELAGAAAEMEELAKNAKS